MEPSTMYKVYKVYSTLSTPQSQKIPGLNQVANSSGGFAFEVDDWKRLERFLVLGSEGGTYYVKEKELTIQNAEAVRRCILEDGRHTVDVIVEISDAGRAPKNDPALFALAMCAGTGNDATRKYALDHLHKVARIGTHLFHFCEYAQQFRSWGRGLRSAVSKWYNDKSAEDTAYQVLKYQSRDGWTNADLLRLSHPKPLTDAHRAVYKWVVDGELIDSVPGILSAFEAIKRADNKVDVIKLIRENKLPREAVPTQWLNESDVWQALLDSMPITALIRNLSTMTKVGLIAPMSGASRHVVEQLSNGDRLHKARVHPIHVLAALKAYEQGHGERGHGSWTPVKDIINALDAAFYISFGNVEPSGKRTLIALDVSGSMSYSPIAGMVGITPRVGSAAMSLVIEATEPENHVMGFSHELVPINISSRMRLDTVIKAISAIPMGGTDCSLPMVWALNNKVKVDTFIVMTDSETWFGGIHPVQALRKYRNEMGIPSKLVVVAMTSNGFSIADPSDAGSLDIVGFDSATPNVIADFSRG